MFERRGARLCRICLAVIGGILLLWSSGCGIEAEEDNEEDHDEIKQIAAIYDEICGGQGAQSEQGEDLGLEQLRRLVDQLGDAGFVAVDEENQIDMTGYQRVLRFCENVEEKNKDDAVILVISYNGGFTRFYLETEGGEVWIVREYYTYQDGQVEKNSREEYQPSVWTYTEEGYLFFEEYHMPGYHGATGRAALRVEPLDDRCRELNRNYMLPTGYYENNLFLLDWSEGDFGDVDFYDLFDIFYPQVYHSQNPYFNEEHKWANTVYQIPQEEFENVIQSYLNITSEELRAKADYSEETKTYRYRARSLEDCEQPEPPYPEVVEYAENGDGTLTLTVNVVYPDASLSKVYAHEVVIRPLSDSDGSFRYVSNRVIPSEKNHSPDWHVDRLSVEEWETAYGK